MDEQFNQQEKENIINGICSYLKIEQPVLHSLTLKEEIKELCVARLCKSIGIKCEYNYKSNFFEFFSNITAEALCNKLKIKIRIAPDHLRLFRYERVNLVDEVRKFLENDDIDEAFIDSFNFIDRFKYLIAKI